MTRQETAYTEILLGATTRRISMILTCLSASFRKSRARQYHALGMPAKRTRLHKMIPLDDQWLPSSGGYYFERVVFVSSK